MFTRRPAVPSRRRTVPRRVNIYFFSARHVVFSRSTNKTKEQQTQRNKTQGTAKQKKKRTNDQKKKEPRYSSLRKLNVHAAPRRAVPPPYRPVARDFFFVLHARAFTRYSTNETEETNETETNEKKVFMC